MSSSCDNSDSYDTVTEEYTDTDTESTVTSEQVTKEKAKLRNRSVAGSQRAAPQHVKQQSKAQKKEPQSESESEYETDTGSDSDPYETIEPVVVTPRQKYTEDQSHQASSSGVQMRRSKDKPGPVDNSNRHSTESNSHEREEMQVAYQQALEKSALYDKVRYTQVKLQKK